MHLFVTQPFISGDICTLEEERVVKYMGRVLRMKPGQTCYIQREENNISTRWNIEITDISKKQIIGTIVSVESNANYLSGVSLLIALPNSFSKIELIVQKCTEVGVDALYFWPGQRSILKTISPKRMERLQAIALESVEQCKRRHIPEVKLIEDPLPYLQDKCIVLFDFVEDGSQQQLPKTREYIGIVGPEGHFGERDYLMLASVGYIPVGLGNTILRTETAAIIGAWHLIHIT